MGGPPAHHLPQPRPRCQAGDVFASPQPLMFQASRAPVSPSTRTDDLGGRGSKPKSGDDPRSSGDVAIKLLGGFGATAGGRPVADSVWRLRKGRELVKLLALAPDHRLHREQLMDALWPERDPAAAANNLHQVVHA